MMAEKEAQRTSLLNEHRGKAMCLACLHLTGVFQGKGTTQLLKEILGG